MKVCWSDFSFTFVNVEKLKIYTFLEEGGITIYQYYIMRNKNADISNQPVYIELNGSNCLCTDGERTKAHWDKSPLGQKPTGQKPT